MSESEIQIISMWLKKSANDLRSALILTTAEDYPTDAVCFHCQQSIEKSLKALLIYKDIEFKKTHDLVYLLNISGLEQELSNNYLTVFAEINYYSVTARYPDEIEDPSIQDSETAYKVAVEIFELVNKRIYQVLF